MVEAVLFVDDDLDLREAMQDVLGKLGVQRVVTAGSLQDVEARRDDALRCELALVDINLGRGEPTGVNVYEWLEDQGFSGRVVFLTGHAAQDPRVQHAATLSGSTVASKPLSVAELRALIGAASPPP
jgi:DNA-binding NtrC family response regulator